MELFTGAPWTAWFLSTCTRQDIGGEKSERRAVVAGGRRRGAARAGAQAQNQFTLRRSALLASSSSGVTPRASIRAAKAVSEGANTVPLRSGSSKAPLKLAASMAATRVLRPAALAVS